MNLVVKIGSQSLLDPLKQKNPSLDTGFLADLVSQIASLKKLGHSVFLVSSGAVASGRMKCPELPALMRDETALRQLLAGIGQVELMHQYHLLAQREGLQVVQILLSKDDFLSRVHFSNLQRLFDAVQAHPKLLPIINENDSVAIDELMFTDNDELAGFVAQQLGTRHLIILTEAPGIFDGDPDLPGSKLLQVLDAESLASGTWTGLRGKSASGRGGIASKIHVVTRMSHWGITSHVAAAREPDILVRLVSALESGKTDFSRLEKGLGSHILPAASAGRERQRNGFKEWLAIRYVEKRSGAEVRLTEELTELLRGGELRDIGSGDLISRGGFFEKGELVDICDPRGRRIGVGMVSSGSEELTEIPQGGEPSVLIRWDDLYIAHY